MSEAVTRSKLAEEVIKKSQWDMPKSAAEDIVRSVFEAMSDALTRGEEVHIHRFGAFKTNERPARVGRNPRTGESIKVPARRVVRFSPSTTLVDTVRSPRGVTKARK